MASETATPEAAPPMFSGTGVAIVLLLLLIEGVAVYLIARYWARPGASGVLLHQNYVEVDLGTFNREVPSGAGEVRGIETFSVQIVVLLHPALHNLDELKAEVEARKALLRSRVNRYLQSQPHAYFRREDLFADLTVALKRELNDELRSTKDGQEVVDRILFSQFRRPER